jgi:pimeloyl-ACP methyl ester carboxylesterase
MTRAMSDGTMGRRAVVLGGGALLASSALAPVSALAADFTSRRIAVSVRGKGRDVLLIPGLASGPGIWNRQIASIPDCRWHLVTVRGFAGLPPDANASGPLLQPLADEVARYVQAAGLSRPAIVGHSMGGTLAMMLGLKGLASRWWTCCPPARRWSAARRGAWAILPTSSGNI